MLLPRIPRLLLPKLQWLLMLLPPSETVLLRFNLQGLLEEPVLNSPSSFLLEKGADSMEPSIVLDLINLAGFFPLLLLRELLISTSVSNVMRLVCLFPLLLLREGVSMTVRP